MQNDARNNWINNDVKNEHNRNLKLLLPLDATLMFHGYFENSQTIASRYVNKTWIQLSPLVVETIVERALRQKPIFHGYLETSPPITPLYWKISWELLFKGTNVWQLPCNLEITRYQMMCRSYKRCYYGQRNGTYVPVGYCTKCGMLHPELCTFLHSAWSLLCVILFVFPMSISKY